jgi:hypothetical protein
MKTLLPLVQYVIKKIILLLPLLSLHGDCVMHAAYQQKNMYVFTDLCFFNRRAMTCMNACAYFVWILLHAIQVCPGHAQARGSQILRTYTCCVRLCIYTHVWIRSSTCRLLLTSTCGFVSLMGISVCSGRFAIPNSHFNVNQKNTIILCEISLSFVTYCTRGISVFLSHIMH